MTKDNQLQKGTILALRHLKKTFYKFMMHGLTYKYNSIIMPKNRLLAQCDMVKIDLNEFTKIKDLNIDEHFNKIYKFINDNFLDQETYRIKIPIDLLKWFLYDCKIKALVDKSEDILSLVAYRTDCLQIECDINEHVNIKLVCTDKLYRHRRFAKRLLAILEKDCINNNSMSGFYMSNIGFMKPFCQLKYYYRPINPEILILSGFSGFKEADLKNKNNNIIDYYKLQEELSLDLKVIKKDDMDTIYELYNENRDRYNFSHVYTQDDLTKILCSDAITAYCVWKNNEIIDFFGYYKIYHESIVNKKRRDIVVGNVFMYTTVNTTVYNLFKNILTLMASHNIDLLSILNNQDSDSIIEPLQFMDSESFNYIYLFNWYVLEFKPNQIGSITHF